MSLLIYLHIVFNQKPVTCLSHLHDNWPRQGVVRVDLDLSMGFVQLEYSTLHCSNK
ncbi:unnamed protein product, partial [Rotaria sp. Silwood2]